MTTTRVEGVGDNAREVSVVGNVGGVSRSTDYADQGIKARDGFSSRSVHSADQLRDNEIITVQGMDMKVSQARELGLIGQVFDQSLSTGAAAQAAQQRQEAPKTEAKTGAAEYDAAIAALEADIDAGTVTLEEAREYDTALAQVAMQGLSVDDVVSTLDGIYSGAIDAIAVPSETKSVIAKVEQSVTTAAEASARNEIGQQGFDELARAAAASPEVAEAIRGYAIMRATGKANGIKWSDFLEDVRGHLSGR